MKRGVLTIVPTPIDNESKLNIEAFETLMEATTNLENNIFVVEDPKPARRRWIRFGLPRDVIEHFQYLNEQTSAESTKILIDQLVAGKNIFLMSDAGLPAFCDPGQNLIEQCHQLGIRVTSTPFFNSVVLALALSGFPHDQFTFYGFIPRKTDEKMLFLRDALKDKKTSILMDTPYRMASLLDSIEKVEQDTNLRREYFLATEIGKQTEQLLRGSIKKLIKASSKLQKPEFIMIVRGLCP